MNEGQFKISLKESLSFLKNLNLLKDTRKKSSGGYSDESKNARKSKNYKDIYDCAICNFDYEFLLNDDSIFQFSFKNDELRYAFIQNPYIYISKEEYVTTIFTQEEVSEINNIDVLADLIDENEYEQFLNEQELNSISNYIRYDTSLSGYKALNHSYSHIHIGLNPDMRVPLSIILTPLKFIKFCIKTSYYRYWQKAFILIPNFENTLKVSKNKCLNLDRTHWNIKEEYDLYIK